MAIIERQFEELQKRFPAAALSMQGNGTGVVTIPGVALPPGWNAAETDVAFVLPAGYPQAQPDCFWTSPTLRLETGGPAQNTGQQAVPGIPQDWVWFSWHPATWNANTDTMETYLNVIRRRLSEIK